MNKFNNISKYFYYSLIGLTFLYFLDISWCKWGELMVDTFRDQTVAFKLAQGKVLYKDIYYLFGILPPYCLGLLNRIFGTTLYCSVGLGIFFILSCSILVYRISRIYMDRLFSTVTTLAYLCLCGFNNIMGYGNSNYVLPYSLATAFTITFVLASLYFFIKHATSARPVYIYLWVISQYLMLLSRFDITMPVYAVFIILGTVLYFKEKRPLLLLYLIAPALLAIATYAIYLKIFHNYNDFATSVLRMITFEGKGNDPFALYNLGVMETLYGAVMPYYDLPVKIVRMCNSFVIQTVVIALLFALTRGFVHLKDKCLSNRVYGVISIIACIIGLFFLSRRYGPDIASFSMFHRNILKFIHFQYAGLPFFLIGGIIYGFISLGKDFKRYLSIIVLMSVSLALLTRIFFNVTTFLYGSFFIVPGLICYIMIIKDFIPSIAGYKVQAAENNKYFLISILIYLTILSIPSINDSLFWYKMRTLETRTSSGRFISYDNLKSRQFWQTVEYLKQNTPSDATLVVLPEGLGLNYFSGRDCPMKYDGYRPDVLRSVGEDNILKEFQARPADYIIITQRPCYEYGYPFFGTDFGVKIYDWIISNYVPIKQIGVIPGKDAGFNFGALILKKKQA